VKDRVHYYFAYEGKKIEEPRQVVLQNDNLLPNAGIVPELRAKQGSTTQEFNEHLLFGRVDAQLNADMRITGTMRVRPRGRPGRGGLAPEPARQRQEPQPTTRTASTSSTSGTARTSSTRRGSAGRSTSGTRTRTRARRWSATPVSPSNSTNNVQDVIFDGGSPDAQNRKQSGTYLQNDFTWLGLTGTRSRAGRR
jgi:hypothetical protein